MADLGQGWHVIDEGAPAAPPPAAAAPVPVGMPLGKGWQTVEAEVPAAAAAPASTPSPAAPQRPGILDTVKQAVTGHAIKSLGGPTVSELYDKAFPPVDESTALGKASEFSRRAARIVPEAADFLLTPVGAASLALPGAPAAVQAGAGAAFSTDMAVNAAKQGREFVQHPTAGGAADLLKTTALAAAPLAHAAVTEGRVREGERAAAPALTPATGELGNGWHLVPEGEAASGHAGDQGHAPVAGEGPRAAIGPEPVVPQGNGPELVRGTEPGEGGPVAGQPAGAGGVREGAGRRVTGSVNVPLTEAGRAQAEALQKRIPEGVRVFTAPNDRSVATGGEGSEAAPWLAPVRMGADEGKPLETAGDAINDRIRNRPDERPGVSPHSGQEGESFHEAAGRIVAGVRQQAAGLEPGQAVLNVTSGRVLEIVDAMRPDGTVDVDKVTGGQSEFSKPGQFYHQTPEGLRPVDELQPGQNWTTHGETEWNQAGGGSPGEPVAEKLQSASDATRTPYDTPAVVEARRKAAATPPTARIVTPEREALRQQIAERLYRSEGVEPQRQAYLVIGPPGAGKSTISEPLASETHSLLVDSDLAKRELPEYANGIGAGAVHEESTDIAHTVLRRAASNGLNIVHPIVGRNLDTVRSLRNRLAGEGYDVHLVHVDLPADTAAQRAVTRFTSTGRFVDPEYVLKIGDAPKRNYDILKAEGGFKSYAQFSNDVPFGQPARVTDNRDFTALRSLRGSGASGASTLPGLGSTEAEQPGSPVPGEVVSPPAESPAAPAIPDTDRSPSPEQGHAIREFLGDEKGTSMVGDIFRADYREMQGLKAKREAALAALEKSKETPQDTKFGHNVLSYFTGERDLWGTRVNQVMARLRKLVPDPVDQEALSLMREFRDRPKELLAFLDGTHPALQDEGVDYKAAMERIEQIRPAAMRALNPTDGMKQADQALTKVAAGTLAEGQRLGFLESRWTPEEYNPHILHPKGEGEFSEPASRAGKAMGGKIGKYFGFAERRDYPTLLDAIADGVRPKTLNALDAFTIHGDRFATARATHLLEKQLADTSVGRYAATGKQPKGWVRLAPHSDEFRKLVPFMRKAPAGTVPTTAGQVAEAKLAGLQAGRNYAQVSGPNLPQTPTLTEVPDVAEMGLWVPKHVEKALRPITDPDYMGRVPLFSAMRHTQSYQKAIQLGLSLFHATSENYMALSNMGPSGWWRGLRADRLDPAFEKSERDFIAHGGTTAVQGKTVEAYKALQPGSIPTWTDIWRKAPVIHQLDTAANAITDFTFGKLQRQFKVTDYNLHQAAWMADHPNATPAELNAAKASIAKEINAVYGGLNTELLGVNRASVEIARAVLLAPDWTFSNVFNVKYALERGGTPAGKMARAFWARQLIGGAAATQLLSLAIAHKPSKNPTQVYFGKDDEGKDIYQNVFFKGASGDVINLVHNIGDYGAVEGLARSVAGKMAGFGRAGLQLATNRDYLGHQVVPAGMNPIAGTVRGAYKTGESLLPIPFSAVNLKNMLIGPEAHKYTAPEFLTTLFSGNPPRHMTERPQKPQQSIWREIVTGKP